VSLAVSLKNGPLAGLINRVFLEKVRVPSRPQQKKPMPTQLAKGSKDVGPPLGPLSLQGRESNPGSLDKYFLRKGIMG